MCVKITKSDTKWVGKPGTFHFTIGGDGWPQNHDPAVDFSVGLFKFDQKIQSPNFVLAIFGENIKKISEFCQEYCHYFACKVEPIEEKIFEILCQVRPSFTLNLQIKFELSLIVGTRKCWLTS